MSLMKKKKKSKVDVGYRMPCWASLSTSEKVGEVLAAVCVFAAPILLLLIGAALQP